MHKLAFITSIVAVTVAFSAIQSLEAAALFAIGWIGAFAYTAALAVGKTYLARA